MAVREWSGALPEISFRSVREAHVCKALPSKTLPFAQPVQGRRPATGAEGWSNGSYWGRASAIACFRYAQYPHIPTTFPSKFSAP